jgi:hypothetical protein
MRPDRAPEAVGPRRRTLWQILGAAHSRCGWVPDIDQDFSTRRVRRVKKRRPGRIDPVVRDSSHLLWARGCRQQVGRCHLCSYPGSYCQRQKDECASHDVLDVAERQLVLGGRLGGLGCEASTSRFTS